MPSSRSRVRALTADAVAANALTPSRMTVLLAACGSQNWRRGVELCVAVRRHDASLVSGPAAQSLLHMVQRGCPDAKTVQGIKGVLLASASSSMPTSAPKTSYSSSSSIKRSPHLDRWHSANCSAVEAISAWQVALHSLFVCFSPQRHEKMLKRSGTAQEPPSTAQHSPVTAEDLRRGLGPTLALTRHGRWREATAVWRHVVRDRLPRNITESGDRAVVAEFVAALLRCFRVTRHMPVGYRVLCDVLEVHPELMAEPYMWRMSLVLGSRLVEFNPDGATSSVPPPSWEEALSLAMWGYDRLASMPSYSSDHHGHITLRESHWHLALSLYTVGCSRGWWLSSDVLHCFSVVRSLTRDGRWSEALRLLGRFPAKRLASNPELATLYTQALQCHPRGELWQRAAEFVTRDATPTSRAGASIWGSFLRGKSVPWRAAIDMWRHIPDETALNSQKLHMLLLNQFIGHWQVAASVLLTFNEAHLAKAAPYAINCFTGAPWDVTLSVISAACAAGDDRMAISALTSKSSDDGLVMLLLRHIQSVKSIPRSSDILYSARWDVACALAAVMMAGTSNSPPSSLAMNNVVRAAYDSGHVDTALAAYDYMVQRNMSHMCDLKWTMVLLRESL
eukprot:PhM_4_TR3412/c2_g1_i2/m.82376